jgi:N-methylhydantoinase A
LLRFARNDKYFELIRVPLKIMKTLLLGVDTGGTFTDFVLFDGKQLQIHKVLSTPHAPEQAILQGVKDLELQDTVLHEALYMVHGSTVATNAVLEGKGVRTAYITNRGMGDVLSIGRQNRRELYNLQPEPVTHPVPRELCLETGGRIAADGAVIEPLDENDLNELREQLQYLAPEAVAINLLFSFVDDTFEKAIESVVPEGMFLSRSSEVLPEYREYERGIATWLNAWIGPLMDRYLTRLSQGLPAAKISVMQSAGGTIDINQAGRKAVHLLLSGPAGGLAGAKFVARQTEHQRLLTFDMGGTSTDVALIDGDIQLTSEGSIGPYPVAVPMVDMHTIGAGGGSIAYVDEGGMLQVGPESAGADPGPACYGQGGQDVTVTDANLILGRLLPDAFLGGGMKLDVKAATAVMSQLAQQLDLDIVAVAEGVIRVANEHMARALRVMSDQRGIDPRELTLVSFGGAGGLHVCALAEAMGMHRAMVPINAGVLSALGMLAAPRARQMSRTLNVEFGGCDEASLESEFCDLETIAKDELSQEGVSEAELTIERSLDLRYRGQTYCLNIPWQDVPSSVTAFHKLHEARYGHRLDQVIELVNVRVRVQGGVPPIKLVNLNSEASQDWQGCFTSVYGINEKVAVFERAELYKDQEIQGPALIAETVSTTYLATGWLCRVDAYGNLLLKHC